MRVRKLFEDEVASMNNIESGFYVLASISTLYCGIGGYVGGDIDGNVGGGISAILEVVLSGRLSLSGDGSTLAISCPDSNVFTGKVIVFRNYGNTVNNKWVQLGKEFKGKKSFDRYGKSISLSNDGNTIAISKPGNGEKGSVLVFELVNNKWSSLGDEIEGEMGDEMGQSISLSDDGSRVAVTSYKRNKLTGNARVY